MPNYKHGRTAEDIKREIAALLREMKDPRIAEAMLTVVRVELADDLSYGKVYVSSLDGIERAKQAVKCLKTATGLFRRELANRLHLRKAPELLFIADDSVEHSMEIFKKLSDLRKKSSENEN